MLNIVDVVAKRKNVADNDIFSAYDYTISGFLVCPYLSVIMPFLRVPFSGHFEYAEFNT